MALIQIDKRAVTPAEGQGLIDRSLGLVDPFGVPTLTITAHDAAFWHAQTQRQNAEGRLLGGLVKRLFGGLHAGQAEVRAEAPALLDRERFGFLLPRLDKILKTPEFLSLPDDRQETALSNIAEQLQLKFKMLSAGHPLENGHFDAGRPGYLTYDPSASPYERAGKDAVVSDAAIVTINGDSMLKYTSPAERSSFNGADIFQTIWHEYAHGLGTNEPQAELISAAVTRRAYEGNGALQAAGDRWAIDSVILHDPNSFMSQYGWGCVDANDFIAAMPDDKAASLSEAQIKALVGQKFDPLTETLGRVSDAVRHSSRSLQMLAQTEFKDDPKAQYIVTRFALACQRTGVQPRTMMSENIQMPQWPDGKPPSFVNDLEI